MERERLVAIGRWLWPTSPARKEAKPEPEPVTWEKWQGQRVKVIAGPFKGREGIADGIGWGMAQVVFAGFQRVWLDGAFLTRITHPSGRQG